MATTVDEVIAAHRAAGRLFEAAGLTSFVRAEGEGEPVVLLHGLRSSSFLYRKVIPELAARGFAAMSFDLPGLGLADRPVGFDFTFAGLGRFARGRGVGGAASAAGRTTIGRSSTPARPPTPSR